MRVDPTDRIAAADALLAEWESMGYIGDTAAAQMRWALGLITRDQYEAHLRAAQAYVPEDGAR